MDQLQKPTSKNKVKMSKDYLPKHSLKGQAAKEYLMKCAAALGANMPGLEYVGSFSQHVFEKTLSVGANKKEYFFISAMELRGMPEGMADAAWKELKKDLMKSYGRKEANKVKR